MGFFDLDFEPFDGKQQKTESRKTRDALTPSMISRIKEAVGNKCEMPACNHVGHEIHHIKPVSQGGTNVGSNLIVLCANHHREVHKGAYQQSELKNIIKNRTSKATKYINGILRPRKKVGSEKKSQDYDQFRFF